MVKKSGLLEDLLDTWLTLLKSGIKSEIFKVVGGRFLVHRTRSIASSDDAIGNQGVLNI
jgi:hypothetical protein